MLAFFEGIVAFISNIGVFITNAIEGVITLFVAIPRATVWLTYVVNFIPAPMVVFIGLMIAFSVLFMILGRHS